MHTAKRLCCSLFILLFPFSIYACGNEYYRENIPIYKNKLEIKYLLNWSDGTTPYWMHGFGEGAMPDGFYDLMEKMKAAGIQHGDNDRLSWYEMELALKKDKDYKLLSDYAWYELRMGNKNNAVKLLEALYEKHPTEYNVLANLGTAYEVTGDNKRALGLLRKAVAINPQSHYGSEWIHIKILEQKVLAAPDYRLILDLGADADPAAWLAGNVYNKEIKPDSLMVQLAFQLHERISFVPAPDPVVGQLVKDFADLVLLTRSKKEAKPYYDYALLYDSTVLSAASRPYQQVQETLPEKMESPPEVRKKNKMPVVYLGIGVLVLAAFVIVILKVRGGKQ
jgi:tetratricopeptide (TPR) repeat protein